MDTGANCNLNQQKVLALVEAAILADEFVLTQSVFMFYVYAPAVCGKGGFEKKKN